MKAVLTKAVLNKHGFYRSHNKARSDAGFFVAEGLVPTGEFLALVIQRCLLEVRDLYKRACSRMHCSRLRKCVGFTGFFASKLAPTE